MKQSLALKRPAMGLGLFLAVSVISLLFTAYVPSASAQTAVSQCNGTDNVGGQAVECRYTVTNNLDGATTSSTVTITECHGAANDPATLICNSTTTSSVQLVTAVDQCNGSGNGGGGTVACSVDIVNNIVGTVGATPATVNQCNAAGGGGGTEPTILCNPFPANTTGATVTQCNEAGNGGGGTQRVQCSVDPGSTTTSVLNVTVNQCIGSGNGGGATVTCRTGITNNITAPAPAPTQAPAPTEAPAPNEPAPTEAPAPNEPAPTEAPAPNEPAPTEAPAPNEPAPTEAPAPNEPAPNEPAADEPTVPDETDGPTGPRGTPEEGDAGGDGGGAGTSGGAGDSTALDTGGAEREETTSQVTKVPLGGVAAGGGSTNGIENTRLFLIGFMMLAASIPALGLRRRIRVKA